MDGDAGGRGEEGASLFEQSPGGKENRPGIKGRRGDIQV